MEPRDKHYLSLQFKVKVHQKSATEFQSLFEDIMEKTFGHGFKKIRLYGNQGDRGNDGYRPAEGIYYQAYAPLNPAEKDADAAQKFKDNFETLKKHWNEISEVRQYNFVFNDKYTGVSIELENAKAELKRAYPDISFEIFTAVDLEEVFFTLKSDQLLSLGFDIDSRNALKIARQHLEKLEIELDRGNAAFVAKALENIHNIIQGQGDESLLLEYEIIEARTLQKLEKVGEAKEKYEDILVRYPRDSRALLYLAEVYLNDENFEKNEELLRKAEQIDPDYWLLPLEKLIREYRQRNRIDISNLDEEKFPNNPKIKSDYYRLYSLFVEQSGEPERARSFIERAIKLNPDKLINYNARLDFLMHELLQANDRTEILDQGQEVLKAIEAVEQRLAEWGGLNARNQVLLNIKKLHIYLAQENIQAFGDISKETFDLAIKCYFDYSIDRIFSDFWLRVIEIPYSDFRKFLDYLKKAEKPISTNLARILVLQFLRKGSLFTDGKQFLHDMQKEEFVEFITNIENKNYDEAMPMFEKDVNFAVSFAVSAKEFPELRKKIIQLLPSDQNTLKEKLLLLLNYEEGKVDEAFSILKNLDLSELKYVECMPTLAVAEKKEAWDFVIILLEKLLKYEKNGGAILEMKLKLFSANFYLERFSEATKLGEDILANPDEMELLNDQNKEILLAQTISAWAQRGRYSEAHRLVKEHGSLFKTFGAKVSVEAEIYIKNNEPENALNSIVEAVKILKRPSPEEYGSLYFAFVQIGNLIDPTEASIASLTEIQNNVFVKLKGQEKWVFVGDEDELDAIKIPEANRELYLNKKLGEKIVIESKYSSEKREQEIENILPIEKYVLWQSMHNAHKLTIERLWDAMETIEVPSTEDGIDPQYLIARLEDIHKKGEKFFETYCEKNLPLAMLAANEHGLTNSIGRILNERKGFIKASAGSKEEMDMQKEVANRIISGEPFYLDGTSALFLAETGTFEKIYNSLPNIRVPQSVISLLLAVAEKFRSWPGQMGYMGYSQGRLNISDKNPAKELRIQKNFERSIELLEAEAQNIEAISSANKADCFSEQNVPASLCDACILAQRDQTPILTEDFLYLQMNKLETKKEAPIYCSSLAMMRVLYEKGKIGFSEYLDYFSYLSSYRVRFLGITVKDLESAVFGDGIIKVVQPEELRKFNFPLTMSEEYGVSIRTTSAVIGPFLIQLLIDDSIIPEVVEKIFSEIITALPMSQNKRIFAENLLLACVQIINKRSQNIILGSSVQTKVDRLVQFLRAYNSGGLILP